MSDTTLPFHPRTGLQAVGIVGGKPVWPILGGSEDVDPAPEADAGGDPDPDDAGDAGKSTKDDDVFDAERARRELNKKNNEAANLRKRLKELEPLAAKAKELEDASKTEAERLSERATSAETKASQAEAELLRLRVAMNKGLTLKQAARLRGATEEELEADADELLEEFGAKKDEAPRVPGKPRESLRGGGKPDDEPEETDPRKLAAAIRRD